MGKPTDLTGPQWTAVEHFEGPLLVLAGPGSGKTRVITRRIARLLERGVSPWEIVAITFTNKAAKEMAARVARLVPGQDVWVSTFHRFCARLLRKYAPQVGLKQNFTILDSTDQSKFLRELLGDLDSEVTQFQPGLINHQLSRIKNRLLSPEEYVRLQGEAPGDPLEATLAKIYPAYQKRLIEANCVDFDDLLLHMVTLLQNNSWLRENLDQRFQFVLVDEFQDTNSAQYQLVRGLSQNFPNLCATGDPDQSIYGWRGAEIQNILDFERDYPQTKVVRLEQNFRSTPEILQVAERLITHNTQRKPKALFTENPSGPEVQYTEFDSSEAESEGLAEMMIREVEAGRRKWGDFAILYRVNALSRRLERAFVRYRVPYQVASGVAFYERAEVKDLIAYLRLIYNPQDVTAFRRVINSPARSLGAQSQARIIGHAQREGHDLIEACLQGRDIPKLSKRAQVSSQMFGRMIRGCSLSDSGSIESLLQKILAETRYTFGWGESHDEESMQRKANIDELLASARAFDQDNAEDATLEKFLEEASLVADLDNVDPLIGKVSLMTLHSAKGLEFPVVVVLGIEENLIPHRRAVQSGSPKELEEERRLLFVGMTRAESELYLTRACRRDVHGRPETTIPSTFLWEAGLRPTHWQLPGRGDPHSQIDHEHEDTDVVDVSEPATKVTPPVPEDDPLARHKARMLAQLAELAAKQKPLLTTGASLLAGTREAATIPQSFAKGMRVRHPSQGYGEVIDVGFGSRRTVTVRFESGQEGTFIVTKCPLQPVGNG